MRLLDLFSGIGGFSFAAHQLGWQTVAFVERDGFCQKVLQKNFAGVPIYDDIFTFAGRAFRGAVDCISGGFPCQPFSHAGRRRGVNDERHLFPETLRVIREVQPAWIVLENVNGLLSMANEIRDVKVAGHRAAFTHNLHDYTAVLTRTEVMLVNCICDEIERAGYAVQPLVIPASAVGAPHERKRVWIVANAKRDGQPAGTRAGGDGKATTKQPSGQDAAADVAGANRLVIDADGKRGRAGRGALQSPDAKISERHDDAEPCDANCGRNAADADDERRNGGGEPDADKKRALYTRCGNDRTQREPAIYSGGNVPFAAPLGLQGRLLPDGSKRPRPTEEQLHGRGRERARWDEDWLTVATRFCRMDDGLPDRVDRLKSLGNSIVPDVAVEIFAAIEGINTPR